jgi:hypothetical protein
MIDLSNHKSVFIDKFLNYAAVLDMHAKQEVYFTGKAFCDALFWQSWKLFLRVNYLIKKTKFLHRKI